MHFESQWAIESFKENKENLWIWSAYNCNAKLVDFYRPQTKFGAR